MTIAKHDYQQTGRDSLYLETICRRLDADIFTSTYYSTPTTTPSVFVGYDMIPEVLGFSLLDEPWQEKRRAILHACAHSMISRNSAKDLELTYPSVRHESTYVAYCGSIRNFFRPPDAVIGTFRDRYELGEKSYVIMAGERAGVGGYKNASLAFRALGHLLESNPLVLLCVGGAGEIEPQLRALAPTLDVRRLALSDEDLRSAYAGAHALLYPSKYEGFGLPPLESMACGTPVIVCRNSSIPEVVGEAALYVDENDPHNMADAIMKLYDPDLRVDLIKRGLKQAAGFTFARMALEMEKALVETHARLRAGEISCPSAAWSELRDFQAKFQTAEHEVQVAQARLGEALETSDALRAGRDDAVRANAATQAALEQALLASLSMRNSPFWKARELSVQILRNIGLRRRV